MTIACAVLAAGASRRLGAPKQLLHVEGQPLLVRTLAAAAESGCDRLAVVLGAYQAEIAAALSGTTVAILPNPEYASGLASSVHVAVRWGVAQGAAALMLCACDQPYLSTHHLRALRERYMRERRSTASAYAGILGVPAIIDACYFDRLLDLRGDRGAGALLGGDIEVAALPWPAGSVDLDTPGDVAAYRARRCVDRALDSE